MSFLVFSLAEVRVLSMRDTSVCFERSCVAAKLKLLSSRASGHHRVRFSNIGQRLSMALRVDPDASASFNGAPSSAGFMGFS